MPAPVEALTAATSAIHRGMMLLIERNTTDSFDTSTSREHRLIQHHRALSLGHRPIVVIALKKIFAALRPRVEAKPPSVARLELDMAYLF